MNKTPLVSIILPTYNWKEKWIRESIESVLNQTYNNFEFIIINDASTNNVEEVIKEYGKKDKRIAKYNKRKNSDIIYIKSRYEISIW